MDAKVDDWVVTPRRGKAVEINALWYNALRLHGGVARPGGRRGGSPQREAHADRAREAFNARFWYEAGGYLYDVVDGEHGDDACCRPNQILAISLPHPVLDESRWAAVLEVAERRLVTPVGLRSLAPGDRDYKAQYYGDLRARDAAYHQGTVWAWLIGPFIDAWLRVHPGEVEAGAPLPRRVPRCPGRGLHRHDRRDLRRGAALCPPRMRGPGVERRRGAQDSPPQLADAEADLRERRSSPALMPPVSS